MGANRLDLAGRNAIVTGGAAGLGFAIAERLAQSSANVCVWDINQDAIDEAVAKLDSEGDGIACGVVGNVADVASVADAVKTTLDKRGGIDITVNNAGISGPNTTSWEYPPEEWQKVIDVNLTGTFLVCSAVIPVMLENDYGRIVNIASVAGKDGNPKAPAYSASKAGIIGLTKALGKELATTNVMVNCVTPAAVRTSIFDQMTQDHIDFMLSKIPMGRFGKAKEIAAMVAWLCSEDCSFSTGGVFDLSGGRSTY
ncbi:MAG: SDR family NAD(P)-dependent oxidoreductase [Rhodospirillales bacterium]|jgi:3-oxoacyl-[acyl-carrier protein] reductase|nr:SDR family NAD(P)-dependent oxidoreductase [Rhodospirillales bacterium]MDP7099888.1 SDR family NAD(P)-dependent oxidoreductase [Rhodospirillales bacterium]MDP7424571.1 SDR family NAD(P)-dependent oxidoreductase [Rhodospirillales bacterium]MDP7624370.1 SDR family NAD(P)-dependent oxidoreductase [Rhodospirillales bacterium]HJO87633.1 SDR family NAD(P)-dependent oxidoreductase [Rhodospirillales bacterium]